MRKLGVILLTISVWHATISDDTVHVVTIANAVNAALAVTAVHVVTAVVVVVAAVQADTEGIPE